MSLFGDYPHSSVYNLYLFSIYLQLVYILFFNDGGFIYLYISHFYPVLIPPGLLLKSSSSFSEWGWLRPPLLWHVLDWPIHMLLHIPLITWGA